MFPCGFCGRSGCCVTSVERQPQATKAFQVASDCLYRDNFSYAAASKSSKSNPCTNRPVLCPVCPPGSGHVWSYSLRDHLLSVHPSLALPSAMNENVKGFEPSCDKHTYMRIDPTTGSIQLSKGGKRKREANPSGEPSSSKARY